MKNNKRILLVLGFFLVMGTGQAMAQEKSSQTVLIRAFELPPLGGGRASRMNVTAPDGSSTSVELSEVDVKTYDGAGKNGVVIQAEITKWKKQGFEVDALSAQTSSGGGIITTILLSKDE